MDNSSTASADLRVYAIENFAYSATTELFVFMLNPNHRGPKFNFATHKVAPLVLAQAGLHFVTPLTPDEECLLVGRAARVWQTFLDESDIESWI